MQRRRAPEEAAAARAADLDRQAAARAAEADREYRRDSDARREDFEQRLLCIMMAKKDGSGDGDGGSELPNSNYSAMAGMLQSRERNAAAAREESRALLAAESAAAERAARSDEVRDAREEKRARDAAESAAKLNDVRES